MLQVLRYCRWSVCCCPFISQWLQFVVHEWASGVWPWLFKKWLVSQVFSFSISDRHGFAGFNDWSLKVRTCSVPWAGTGHVALQPASETLSLKQILLSFFVCKLLKGCLWLSRGGINIYRDDPGGIVQQVDVLSLASLKQSDVMWFFSVEVKTCTGDF